MNPETVIVMMTEKSIDINHVRGGCPDFTSADAIRALGGMSTAEYNYTQYVLLEYKQNRKILAQHVYDYIKTEYSDICQKKANQTLFHLAKICCDLQLIPNKKVPQSEIYENCLLTRGEWQYQWQAIYSAMLNYLNMIKEDVYRHIYRKTK